MWLVDPRELPPATSWNGNDNPVIQKLTCRRGGRKGMLECPEGMTAARWKMISMQAEHLGVLSSWAAEERREEKEREKVIDPERDGSSGNGGNVTCMPETELPWGPAFSVDAALQDAGTCFGTVATH
ncbi:hypothetical protein BDZ97DRAFT_1754780 [Flammula alnicola]|nr:hypothetical protein BDZ97DRAFT_1767690 [Flammula alnicola]KAF8969166.1 hypothetical protein BDZ97DRAFT_1754780 [Flammula alnicola]